MNCRPPSFKIMIDILNFIWSFFASGNIYIVSLAAFWGVLFAFLIARVLIHKL